MKVLLSWLREFAPFDADPFELGDQMSDLGMAVESIELLGTGLDGVVVAKVLELRPHPNADKIQLVDVDLGDGEALQICCGAFNMAVGDLVPLATLGTVMPGGMRIERRKLRGEWSNGMLCSAAELGFGDDQAGIMILPDDLDAGTDLRSALAIQRDVLYDLEINPNRPDAMSVAGVARDLAARMRVPFSFPEPNQMTTWESADETAASVVSVEILDKELCGRFYARVLKGLTAGPSPRWMADRLTAAGMRPINSVVDVSNYVMLELGQPSHTYDLSKLVLGSDGRRHLSIRWARDGETLTTLDGVERVLSAGDGVIADAGDTAIGIAGVMGGESTEIDDSTSEVLLEMAWWDPMTIARSSHRLGLRSEASMRFERGTDPEIIEFAAQRFIDLLEGVTPLADNIDVRGDLPARESIRVRTGRVNALLGTNLDSAEIKGYLVPIGFGVEAGEDSDEQLVTIPSFRPDTNTETDVIEEIARHYGYANIPRSAPPAARVGRLTSRQIERRLARQTLVGLGLDEAMPMPFIAPDDLARSGLPTLAVRLTNPLAAEESVLRTSLRPGLLKAIAFNESHRNVNVGLFEIGKVFGSPQSGEVLPDEHERLTVVIAGGDISAAIDVWSVLADSLVVLDWRLDQREVEGLHPGRGAHVLIGGDVAGVLGEVHPSVVRAFGIDERVVTVDVDLDRVLAGPYRERQYHPVSRFPSSDIDLAFEVDETITAAQIAHTITEVAGDLLVRLELFDVFRGTSLPDGTRSLAYALRLQAPDRTLTDEQVGQLRSEIVSAVEHVHGASLRG